MQYRHYRTREIFSLKTADRLSAGDAVRQVGLVHFLRKCKLFLHLICTKAASEIERVTSDFNTVGLIKENYTMRKQKDNIKAPNSSTDRFL